MKKFNEINVEVVWGQITALEADAYVVPQYPDHLSDTPMVREIRSLPYTDAAFEVYSRYIKNNPQNMCAAISSYCKGGNCRMLMHSIILGGDVNKLSSDVEDAVNRILTLSNTLGVKSIAMPLLGYGEFGSLSATDAAKAVLSGITCFKSPRSVKEITIVIPDSPGAVDDVLQVLQTNIDD